MARGAVVGRWRAAAAEDRYRLREVATRNWEDLPPESLSTATLELESFATGRKWIERRRVLVDLGCCVQLAEVACWLSAAEAVCGTCDMRWSWRWGT